LKPISDPIFSVQLCLAMADLALQMTSWKTPIEDLINKYNQTNMWPLLEILTVFPEEVNSRLLRLGANRRNEVIQELSSHSKIILEYLVSYTSEM
jgi:transportin-3